MTDRTNILQTCTTEAEARAIVRRLWSRGWDVHRVGVVVYLDSNLKNAAIAEKKG